jgi:multicomponent Na+:H+ antiporter subunit G
MLLLNLLSVALLLLGVLFILGGTVGLIRLPDIYTRAHAAGKCDTVGAGSLLLGLMLHDGVVFEDLKLLLLIGLILVSGPTAAHALARSAYRSGLVPWRRREGRQQAGGVR